MIDSNQIILSIIQVVKEWEKRKVIQDRKHLMDKFPSFLTYIAGKENNDSVVKVFLRNDDKEVMKYFSQFSEKYIIKSVNVTKQMKEQLQIEKRKEKEIKEKVIPPIDNFTRKRLNEIIKTQSMKLTANFSNIVGISYGNMSKGTEFGKPCIVLGCLDKTLIPFGEKPLPDSLEGYPVDIKHDFIMFGHCEGCNTLKKGCSIGIPMVNEAGSLGIFVKVNSPSSFVPTKGFLTAAHVAIEQFTELYETNQFLTNHTLGKRKHEIVHPSSADSKSTQKIGETFQAFCGNYGLEEERIGIDAAFVTCEHHEGNKQTSQVC